MEEERREEVEQPVQVEVKEEKPKRSTKSKVITVMLCLALFCVFSVLLLVILDKGDKEEGNKEGGKKEEVKITYEIKENDLYVNSKKVSVTGALFSQDRLFKLSDAVIAGDCRSVCDWYIVDSNANIVGTIGTPVNATATAKEVVRPKFLTVEVEKVEGKLLDREVNNVENGWRYEDRRELCS